MANEGGIWRLLLTTRNEIPAAVEKDIAALNRLETKARTTQGGLARVLGKIAPGGAVGNATSASIGGGIGATVATGVAFASLSAMRSMVEQAMELDSNAKRSEAAMKALTRSTDETVSALSQFGTIIETLKMAIQAIGSSNFARNINLARLGAGSIFDTALQFPGAKSAMGLMDKLFPGSAGALSGFMSDQTARGLAGMAGDDLGTQQTGRALTRLEEARKQRREKQAKRSDSFSNRAPISMNVDDYARMGLFIGGRSSQQEQTGLMKEQKRLLELVNRSVMDLAPRIADHL